MDLEESHPYDPEPISDDEPKLVPDEPDSTEIECDSEKETANINFKEGDWVKVRFSYNKGINVYIRKVLQQLEKDKDQYNGTFLCQSTKCSDIFAFLTCQTNRNSEKLMF